MSLYKSWKAYINKETLEGQNVATKTGYWQNQIYPYKWIFKF